MYALLLISQNSLAYLEAPVIGVALKHHDQYGMTDWAVIIIYSLYVIGLFMKGVYEWIMQAMGKKKRPD